MPPEGARSRRELIRDRVVEAGPVRNEDLAAEFGVTVMTVDAAALVDTTVRQKSWI
jgi:hypothetical protein